jgi:glycosyltransferase involved in cell wall biosynthesis
MSGADAARELILLPSLKAERGPGGGLVLTQKYLEGAAAFARSWPGPVTSLVRLTDQPGTDMDLVEIAPGPGDPQTGRTGIEHRPADGPELVARLGNAAAALAHLSPLEARAARLCRGAGVPFLCTSEYTLETEWQIIAASVTNPLRGWRRKLWAWQAERTRRAMLPDLAGLQCSGTPTFEAYRAETPNPMLFFDNRVQAADVIDEAGLEAKLAGLAADRPLRLVFGGRLVAMKGVMDLPRVAAELVRLEIPFSLEIYGTGPLEADLRAEIARCAVEDNVTLEGALDFRTGWIPRLKAAADLFVCCHPQGDPSSTYPEVMSCGVPIAGYDNAAFRGVVDQSGSGWLSPLGVPARLAEIIARLHRERDALAAATRQARVFALEHAFEGTFARRTQHLIDASRLPTP